MQLSAIQFTGGRGSSSCGYCKQKNCSFSDGMHAIQLSPEDYQDLIDRGWRRSGCYCYKPNNSKTCCPCYTIRCDTYEFKLSKSHKKILKRMKKFLHDGIKDDAVDLGDRQINDMCDISEEAKICMPENKPNLNSAVVKKLKVDSEAEEIKNVDCKSTVEPGTSGEMSGNVEMIKGESIVIKSIDKINDNNKPVQKKAKQLRIERKKAKLEAKGMSLENLKPNPPKNSGKTLADYINETNNESLRHKLKIELVPSINKGEIVNQEFNLYYKYQNIIHNDPPDKITKPKFTRFLCDSPLQLKKSEKGPANGFGSFHQQYWLDDKLIAVGVIDVLPKCISSVYFFYDPDYNFLSLGTYGCLREINFTRQLSQSVPELKFYYMGFYIHSCPKMRYKGKLLGSYLLCPEKYTWHVLSDEIKTKLDENKYVIFNTKADEKDTNEFNQNDLDDIQILFTKSGETTYTPYKHFKRITNSRIDDDLINFGTLVGKNCCRRILYCK